MTTERVVAAVEEAIVEEINEISVLPEPVYDVIKGAAEKKIKKSATYLCHNGHRFKGKDMAITIEQVNHTVSVSLACPECDSEDIRIPSPILVIDMRIGG